MQFTKADLLARVNARIQAVRAENARRTTEHIQQQEQALRAWKDQEAPRLQALADWIADTLRATGVITDGDVKAYLQSHPRNPAASRYSRYFGDLNCREWEANRGKAPGLQSTEELEALQRLLTASTDDVITTSGLERIGFTKVATLFLEV